MKLSDQSAKRVRACGGVWLVVAPILWIMAGISSVESDVVYALQLSAFSATAAVGFVCGIGALFGRVWAARGLWVVSGVGATYFFGVAAYVLVLPFVPWTTLKEPGMKSMPMSLPLAGMSAPVGIPFLFIAVAIRRALRDSA